ncbi:MAG: hypothetical protein M0P31_13910 [Solirubrobacteraceae bacterium]|nr:hypothetical protein [Solirubrobacteraceae bacterium]
MSVHKGPDGRYRVRWRDETGRNRQRTFDRKGDADEWDTEVRRLRQRGHLGRLDGGRITLAAYVDQVVEPTHIARLAPATQLDYAGLLATHILPDLGSVPLKALTLKRLRGWQADRVAAGAGATALNHALDLVGMILQRAAEDGEIEANPVRLVRRLKKPPSDAVRPLAPATVEAIRRRLELRDATIVSVLAYAGLRPGELYALRWDDVQERTIHVQRAVDGSGGVKTTKTTATRSVRILAPLASDLARWRLASGNPRPQRLVFPVNGRTWATKTTMGNWRDRRWRPAWRAAGAQAARDAGVEPNAPLVVETDGGRRFGPGPQTGRGRAAARMAGLDPLKVARPYDLRHSFASLLLAEGRTVHYVAAQLGHDPRLTLSTYGHVIAEFEDAPRVDPDDAIREARGISGSRLVRNDQRTGTDDQ